MTTNEQRISISGFEIFVKTMKPVVSGNETTVFLHDSLGCTTLWRDFPQRYMELTGHQIVIYDRRGYGKSTPYQQEVRGVDYMEREADVLYELLQFLNIDQCTLFGHSDGATISLIAASKYPDRVKQLIIEGPHIYVEEITRTGVREASITYQNTDLKQRLQKYHGMRTEEMVNAWISIWLSDLFRDWNISHLLPAVACPVAIFQGEKDEFGTAQQVWDIKNEVSGSCEAFLIPEVGHTPHKECPDLVLRYLKEYFADD
ncbi:MAG: alpha/beta hydrolase [Bacteroidota bacterium]